MKIKYKNKKIEEICTNIKKATLHFGGDKNMAISLFSRINALQQSETITCFLENRLKSCAKSIGLDTVRTLFYPNKSYQLVIL